MFLAPFKKGLLTKSTGKYQVNKWVRQFWFGSRIVTVINNFYVVGL